MSESFSRSCYSSDELLYKAKAEYFEQQNEALMAQVAEMRELINNSPSYLLHGSAEGQIAEYLHEARRVVGMTPQQSLDSLKSKVEEETIERCAEEAESTEEYYSDHAIYGEKSARSIMRLPRKYKE